MPNESLCGMLFRSISKRCHVLRSTPDHYRVHICGYIVFTMSTESNGVAFPSPRNAAHTVVVRLIFRHSSVSITEGLLHDVGRFPSPTIELYLLRFHIHTPAATPGETLRAPSQTPPKAHLLLACRIMCTPPGWLDAVRGVAHPQCFHLAHPIVNRWPGATASLTPVTGAAVAALASFAPLAYRTATFSWRRYRAPLLSF